MLSPNPCTWKVGSSRYCQFHTSHKLHPYSAIDKVTGQRCNSDIVQRSLDLVGTGWMSQGCANEPLMTLLDLRNRLLFLLHTIRANWRRYNQISANFIARHSGLMVLPAVYKHYCQRSMRCVSLCMYCVPYSGKFSREKIFAKVSKLEFSQKNFRVCNFALNI